MITKVVWIIKNTYFYQIMKFSTDLSLQPANYFPALTGIRAISAYLVFIHHYHSFPQEVLGQVAFRILKEAHIGVSIFFVLSGFLITYRYFHLEIFSFKKYIINRIARIYPVYFTLTLLTFLINPDSFKDSYIVLLLNLTFLRGFFHQYLFSGVAPGWSLTVEETFYITAPLIFYLIRKHISWVMISPVILLFLGYLFVDFFQKVNFHGFISSNSFMLLYTFFGRSFEFFIGIALAMFYSKNNEPIKGFKYTFIGVLMIGACMTGMAYFSGETFQYGIFHPAGIFINNVILPLTGVSLLFYGLLKEKTLLSIFLSSSIMVKLGKSSYIFYLIHMGIVSATLMRISQNHLFLFISLNAISLLMYKYYEEPLNHYIRKRFAN
jgi:peptidoglycan/LPS O-acetylase OafA/YrhL